MNLLTQGRARVMISGVNYGENTPGDMVYEPSQLHKEERLDKEPRSVNISKERQIEIADKIMRISKLQHVGVALVYLAERSRLFSPKTIQNMYDVYMKEGELFPHTTALKVGCAWGLFMVITGGMATPKFVKLIEYVSDLFKEKTVP